MLNKKYRLINRKTIDVFFEDAKLDKDHIIVRPTYLSICAADQRYYNFERSPEVLKKKLPMALIHEAVGTIVYDPKGEYKSGEKVILIPNIPVESDEVISENYLRSSIFRSSGYDGFMQELIKQPRDRVVKYCNNMKDEVMAFSELMSVAIHAIDRFDKKSHKRKEIIGVWGDGALGFITTLFLRYKYSNAKIIVFGKSSTKLNYFTFVDERYLISDDLSQIKIDHAFECVGGQGSLYAINQIIDIINPEGTISLLGVSEDLVSINTRMCLEKGLILIGNSRSGKKDFEELIKFLEENDDLLGYLESLVSSVEKVRTIDDIKLVFEKDKNKYWGKTIIKWEI